MFTGLIVIGIIAAVLLVLIILAQNPKGGINNQLGAGSNVMGVKKTTDFLEKATWVLAVVVIGVSVAATKVKHAGDSKQDVDVNIKAASENDAQDNTFDPNQKVQFNDTL